MNAVLSILSTLIATTTAQCPYASMGDTDYALDVCIGDFSIGHKITCSLNDTMHAEFAMYEYANFTCTGTPNSTIIATSPGMVGIEDYSCTGTVSDCDYSLALIYTAINETECGDSAISPFAMKIPMWNGYCDNGTIFSVTNCNDSIFQMTVRQYNDSNCTTDAILYNYTESIPFDMDGDYHCMELTSENFCTVDTNWYGSYTLYPTSFDTPYPTSFDTPYPTSDNTMPPLECDHIRFDACFLGMCLSMVQAAGICTTEVEDAGFRNLETKHEKAVCENGIYYLRQYINDDCTDPYTESTNFVEMLQMYLMMSNVTNSPDEIDIPVVCDTNTICPYVKIREWEESSVTDCSITPKDNEEYSDDIFVLNECTSMESMDGSYGIKYECENNIVTRSIWTNSNCNGNAMHLQQALVGSYLECEINDKKEVILECNDGFTQDPTKHPTMKPTGDTSQFELNGILLFTIFVCFFV